MNIFLISRRPRARVWYSLSTIGHRRYARCFIEALVRTYINGYVREPHKVPRRSLVYIEFPWWLCLLVISAGRPAPSVPQKSLIFYFHQLLLIFIVVSFSLTRYSGCSYSVSMSWCWLYPESPKSFASPGTANKNNRPDIITSASADENARALMVKIVTNWCSWDVAFQFSLSLQKCRLWRTRVEWKQLCAAFDSFYRFSRCSRMWEPKTQVTLIDIHNISNKITYSIFFHIKHPKWTNRVI